MTDQTPLEAALAEVERLKKQSYLDGSRLLDMQKAARKVDAINAALRSALEHARPCVAIGFGSKEVEMRINQALASSPGSALQEAVESAGKALEGAEWASYSNDYELWSQCPACHCDHPNHAPDCTTLAALALLAPYRTKTK